MEQRDTRVSCFTKAQANDSSTDAQGETGIQLCVCSDWWVKRVQRHQPVTWTFTEHSTLAESSQAIWGVSTIMDKHALRRKMLEKRVWKGQMVEGPSMH